MRTVMPKNTEIVGMRGVSVDGQPREFRPRREHR
jgi:hypothetical protein